MEQTTVGKLNKGDYFTLKSYKGAAVSSRVVWVRSFYCPRERRYLVYRASDICDSKLMRGSDVVFTDFEY